MKVATKKTLKAVAQLGLFAARNWKIVTGVVAIASASAAGFMGKLTPLADAVSQVQL